MGKKRLLFFILLLFLGTQINMHAQEVNTPLTVLKVIGISVVTAESVNLLYHLIQKISFNIRERKRNPYDDFFDAVPPVQKTNLLPVQKTNLITLAEPINTEPVLPQLTVTKKIPPEPVETNMEVQTKPEPIQSNIIALMSPEPIITNTEPNQPVVSTNIVTMDITSYWTNLSDQDQQNINLFGRDFYYTAAMGYFKVKKYVKARDYMFHSIAIGERVGDGIRFLKENFHLTDREIKNGVKAYIIK